MNPRPLSPIHLFQLIRGNTEVFPAERPPPSGTCPEHLTSPGGILVRSSNHLNWLLSKKEKLKLKLPIGYIHDHLLLCSSDLPQWYSTWLREAFKFCYNVSWHQPTVKQFKKPLDGFHLKSHVALKNWAVGGICYSLDVPVRWYWNKTHSYWGIKKSKHSTSWRQVAASLLMIHKNHKLSPTLDCVSCRMQLEVMLLCWLWYEYTEKMLTIPAQRTLLCAVFALPVLAMIKFSVV